MKKEEVLEKIRGKLIVSCQGSNIDGNPFYTPDLLLQMAKAAYGGGCAGFRANEPENIRKIKKEFPDVPMIGIWKIMTEGNDVYITPTIEAVDTLVNIGCEIVALDGTKRINAYGKNGWDLIREVKSKYPELLIMADIADLEDAIKSSEAGADIVSTTLSGYTDYTKANTKICDFDLILKIKRNKVNAFIIAEGKIWNIEDAIKAFDCGADSIVVGTAITSPIGITKRYVTAINEYNKNSAVI
ncbi:MAG: N-acetylmannosamine-6-phosphate 2-epimerase [Bacteroidaceae bacterium]|nr:N-acetylmannosamine-6-phosphate 2-epimerase [Bacteroidaceae bacterium]MEA5017224.1 N-acetylmannosamine-6-phosphate 2-epimerase [Erysipelotrichaceae bacterium]